MKYFDAICFWIGLAFMVFITVGSIGLLVSEVTKNIFQLVAILGGLILIPVVIVRGVIYGVNKDWL